ncbi:MAG: hypothetical protein PW735_11340 [Acidobacteriaceae bacterium]|nr:hypothetical protein [Acidobacteriaceae bacterium]
MKKAIPGGLCHGWQPIQRPALALMLQVVPVTPLTEGEIYGFSISLLMLSTRRANGAGIKLVTHFSGAPEDRQMRRNHKALCYPLAGSYADTFRHHGYRILCPALGSFFYSAPYS